MKMKATLERPVLAVDAVVFTIENGRLMVLTYRRSNPPFKGAPALPGVAVRVDETLFDAVIRGLMEKAGPEVVRPDDIYLEQLAAFDAIYRDPRGRTVSMAFMGILSAPVVQANSAQWQYVSEISKARLPFDHYDILKTGLDRLAGKIRYTNIARFFLPDTFRIDELQMVYEAILQRSLNRTNFRNKLLKIGMIHRVRVLLEAVGSKGGRPPHLYRFSQDHLVTVDRDFL